jgi:Type III secretion system lipoprotein chaperone (YscW)
MGVPSGAALPDGTQWVVELRDDTRDLVPVEQLGMPVQRPPTIAFRLSLDPQRWVPTHAHSVRGVLRSQGRVHWLSDSMPVTPMHGTIGVGVLPPAPFRFHGVFASTLRCGERSVSIGVIGERLRLSVGSELLDMDPVPGVVPGRFERAGDPTSFVVLDDQPVTVSVRGQVFVPCSPMPWRAVPPADARPVPRPPRCRRRRPT